jgi:hypothetical protein
MGLVNGRTRVVCDVSIVGDNIVHIEKLADPGTLRNLALAI